MSGGNLTDLMPPPNRLGNLCPLRQLFRLCNFYKIGPPCQLFGQGSCHIPLIGLSCVPWACHIWLTLSCIKCWAGSGSIVGGCLTAWNFPLQRADILKNVMSNPAGILFFETLRLVFPPSTCIRGYHGDF